MEKVYQYYWNYRLWQSADLHLCDGRPVEVLHPGVLNRDAGPDFFNAKIRINDVEWVGNVEIHVKASDWHRHGHGNDAAYDNIILHVVGADDARIQRHDGSPIPQLALPVSRDFMRTYASLTEGDIKCRCAGRIAETDDFMRRNWLESMGMERLQEKAQRAVDLCNYFNGDWAQCAFATLARALGFGLNAEPLEMLAKSVPLKVLFHHSDNIFQLQAILFGQAGMLDAHSGISDEYYLRLCHEYLFLLKKYGLKPLTPTVWKFARTRPQNFPLRRIAVLAKAVEGGFKLLGDILDARDVEEMRSLLEFELPEYWKTHYTFTSPCQLSNTALTEGSINLLIINMALPLLYAVGQSRGDGDMMERAADMLASLPPEDNAIIRSWKSMGIECDSALRSQALIHVRRQYCETGKCLYCRIGHALLRRSTGEV